MNSNMINRRRRKLLKKGTQLTVSCLAGLLPSVKGFATNHWTPAQTEGPFYPIEDQPDTDLDLTRINGHSKRALGQIIRVTGKVTDINNKPVPGVKVEIWQANHWGKYAHKRDPNSAPLDPNFQGWGITNSSTDGSYGFLSIMPGSYPASFDWIRPPHIHFKLVSSDHVSLTTQMYFPGHKLNESDQILLAIPKSKRHLVIANFDDDTSKTTNEEKQYKFNIVLR